MATNKPAGNGNGAIKMPITTQDRIEGEKHWTKRSKKPQAEGFWKCSFLSIGLTAKCGRFGKAYCLLARR